ncbi:hypothetical protein RHAL1_02245 [Beijerinckiaceae bacterium RH AL1]|nr:hypothetical protein RHAL1_02245 [Beijerinckiaceae bacterium RH AL1]
MISPATQPSSAAPNTTRIGKRFRSRSISVEPKTMSGTDSPMPKAMSQMLLSAAAATATTLSSDMIASASAMVRTAPQIEPVALTFFSSSSWRSRSKASHSSSTPLNSLR